MPKSAMNAFRKSAVRKASMMNTVTKKKNKLAVTGNPRAVARRATTKVAPFQPVSPGGAFRTQPGIRTMANPAIRRGAKR